MPIFSEGTFTTFPSFAYLKSKPHLEVETADATLEDDDLDLFNSDGKMTGPESPIPFIKDEPDDQFNPNNFMGHHGFGMTQQLSGHSMGGINPSDLSTGSNFLNGYGSQNFPSSFTGNAGFSDDELADIVNFDDQSKQQTAFQGFGDHNSLHQNQGFYHEPMQTGAAASMNNAGSHMNSYYSHTPEGAPIQSPAVNGFDFSHYASQMHQAMRPGIQSLPSNAGLQSGTFASRKMQRQPSDSRSPLTPKTPALGPGIIDTPESGSFGSQPIMTNSLGHRNQKSMSSQWEHTPGSFQSWGESPLNSPPSGAIHSQIDQVLSQGKHQSLPAKVDTSLSASVPSIQQTQEIKRRRRRESHNLVERRRRDNINERIQDLSRLVPQHRLEDEKVRKHIHQNGPLSPSLPNSGMSPPQATSLLAGGTGRRAAGNITTGLPIEEKDKGPNKGDILNGAVSWTRDLMWMLNRKIQQCDELKMMLENNGGDLSAFDETDEEKRMRTELLEAFQKNHIDNFQYSRAHGSGLRVPKHTNVAGDPLNPMSPQSLSPGIQSGGSGANSGGNGQPSFWTNPHSGSSGRGSFSAMKEEDGFGMDMS